jgi:hypothetical protein
MAALSTAGGEGRIARFDSEMVELSVLLPSWQADALESAAENQGLTTAQMVRVLIRDFFDHLHAFEPQHD